MGRGRGAMLVAVTWLLGCTFSSVAPGGSAGDGGETEGQGSSTSATSTGLATGTASGMDATAEATGMSDTTDTADTAEGTDTTAPVDTTGSIAPELDGLRIELPCIADGCGDRGCVMLDEDADATMLVGDPRVVYDVTLRFRGVAEQKSYDGPGQDGFFHPDGTPIKGGYNTFGLTVDDPAHTYWLNSGASGILECFPIDMEHTIPVRGGTTLTLHGENGGDTCGVMNLDGTDTPVVIPDIPPAPTAFDGQFMQVDAVSIQ